ncbi:PQQ-dependent sugar dehydrogenase [Rufibacter sediminis]|uniref:Sorbosone dehydrogenase family protein n=1 Tax=Rufibacter sediminis TaxID=2762756 RepID=A0ABR6VST4_9BACT|nr:sorbosone dehydrogenase family protein [Rufibacter sediminis]MBC3540244.1 sorbosone dehydrogenase family protein [Rufibacter sediminis]
MKRIRIPVACFLMASGLYACNSPSSKEQTTDAGTATSANTSTAPQLPAPYATESVKNYSKVIGWPADKLPQAPPSFTVNKFADGLRNPRWIYVAPNGNIFVSEAETEKKGAEKVAAKVTGQARSQNMGKSANRITLFRDRNQDGIPEERYTFLRRLNQPFGMLVLNDYFYVANTDGLWRYPYQAGQTSITGKGEKILELPAGGYNNHWTRNLLANAQGSKIYIAVGSGSNNGENGMENEVRRANILEINPDGSGERVYASGLRNPVGIDWAPGSNVLWAAVNERDELGDELVPDYLTSVKEGGFYGWPYAYFGPNEDPRMKGQRPDLVKKTLVPEVSLGAHTASLGLAFYKKSAFPGKYRGGAFIGQHGSWNRSDLVGYKVVYVPFQNGKPTGPPEDFLTGFIADSTKNEVYGRPVGLAVLPDGSLLVADDSGNTIWRVAAK